jgi:hypothetical protein
MFAGTHEGSHISNLIAVAIRPRRVVLNCRQSRTCNDYRLCIHCAHELIDRVINGVTVVNDPPLINMGADEDDLLYAGS